MRAMSNVGALVLAALVGASSLSFAQQPPAPADRPGSAEQRRLGYRLMDSTGANVRYLIGDLGQSLPAGTEGGWSEFEPPAGWVPAGTEPGRRWSTAFNARGSFHSARVELSAEAGTMVDLQLPVGRVTVLPVTYRGWVNHRSDQGVPQSFKAEFRIHYQPDWRAIVQFDYDVVGSSSSSFAGVPRRFSERLLVVRINPDDEFADATSASYGSLLPAAPMASPRERPSAASARLGYKLVDLFSGSRRRFVIDDHQARSNPQQGDWFQFEPPSGWIPVNVKVGQRWTARFVARDGPAPSQVQMTAEAGPPTSLQLKSGRFTVLPLVYEGWADRSTGYQAAIPHKLRFRLWFEPESRRVVAFESEVTAGFAGGGNFGRHASRERVELARIDPEDDFIEFGED